jgi:hypothetical protein
MCSCGKEESRDQAIIRTVCEYGVLRFDRDSFKIAEVREFLNRQASKTYLRGLLPKYFERVPKQHIIKFFNQKKPFLI